MADEHLPAPWRPRNEVVHADLGGWLSGPSGSNQVRPADLEPGDTVIRDGAAVIVERTRPGGRGWIIWWHAGTACGMFDVTGRERITRLVKDNWHGLG